MTRSSYSSLSTASPHRFPTKLTTSSSNTPFRTSTSSRWAYQPLTIRRALATVTDTLYGVTAARHGKSSSSSSTSTPDFFAQHAQHLAAVDPEFASNPILHWSEFPDFAAVKPSHVVPAMTALVHYVETQFQQRSKQFTPTWEGTMGLTQDLDDDLERASGVITHLSMVKDSPELRSAVEAIQPMIVKISLQMGQSLEFYDALVKMRGDAETWNGLDREQQRIVDKAIQGMKLSGVGFGLPGEGNAEKRKRFNEIQERKAQLSLKFSNNVQDATKAFVKLVTDKTELEGCPESLVQAMAKNAQKRGHGDGDAGIFYFILPFGMFSYNFFLKSNSGTGSIM